MEGSNAAVVSTYNGRSTPLPFKEMLDAKTGKAKIRMVDTSSESYHIARQYMGLLSPEDVF